MLIVTAILAVLAAASPLVASSSCTSFHAPITASAQNFNLSDPTQTQTFPVSGTFSIFFQYCPPLVSIPHRSRTLQVALHGSTYTTAYWDLPFQPERYSYVQRARLAGYHVLNFDRLGAGKSERPDPNNVAQIALEIEIAIEIVQRARRGELTNFMPSFAKIIGIGHSLGSLILLGLPVRAPETLDAFIGTGTAHSANATGLVLFAKSSPADQSLPQRFGGLDPGYLVILNRTFFYGPEGTFNPQVLALDVTTQDVTSTGEGVVVPFIKSAPNFRGHVLTVDGGDDPIFCIESGCPNLDNETTFYPQAASVEAHVTPNSGHCLNLHLNAPETYTAILSWLERKGF